MATLSNPSSILYPFLVFILLVLVHSSSSSDFGNPIMSPTLTTNRKPLQDSSFTTSSTNNYRNPTISSSTLITNHNPLQDSSLFTTSSNNNYRNPTISSTLITNQNKLKDSPFIAPSTTTKQTRSWKNSKVPSSREFEDDKHDVPSGANPIQNR
ncbi:hypothetical protein LIER_26599 [Lithospermum erythrorhizon]|uniref:Uncharacterized protein n=1 Tax=Lithospermum erythrorhizon TaxID=34254 RepID=A0AAV3RCZ6_LITER